jgi:hypothetical protein
MLSYAALVAATSQFHPRQDTSNSTVAITDLSQSHNSTGGTGSVAAAGDLSSFGNIGVGCGINWQDDVSFGGKSSIHLHRTLMPSHYQ